MEEVKVADSEYASLILYYQLKLAVLSFNQSLSRIYLVFIFKHHSPSVLKSAEEGGEEEENEKET